MLFAVLGLALVATFSAAATSERSASGPFTTGAAEQSPAGQIARLKREVAALKRQVASLKAANKKLRAQNIALSPQGIAARLAQVKSANERYSSVDAAKAGGYVPASPCESVPGTGFPAGAMGFHYLNPAAAGDQVIDPLKPEILLYAPTKSGVELIGVEYFKADADQSLTTDSDRPTLFGRAFDGPMLGHAPGMPIHYDLHVWLYKANPSGMFAVWNPAVSCTP
jgi:hypothetical protein